MKIPWSKLLDSWFNGLQSLKQFVSASVIPYFNLYIPYKYWSTVPSPSETIGKVKAFDLQKYAYLKKDTCDSYGSCCSNWYTHITRKLCRFKKIHLHEIQKLIFVDLICKVILCSTYSQKLKFNTPKHMEKSQEYEPYLHIFHC